ncbi:MAG: hypothetical protein L0H84_06405 [Pseudonocardia sp.]|nr:hypothetical protein [Pseudonocardia sp.]
MLLVDNSLTLVASTPQAAHLLSLLDPGPGGALPVAVQTVVATLAAIENGRGTPDLLPHATVPRHRARPREIDLQQGRGAQPRRTCRAAADRGQPPVNCRVESSQSSLASVPDSALPSVK